MVQEALGKTQVRLTSHEASTSGMCCLSLSLLPLSLPCSSALAGLEYHSFNTFHCQPGLRKVSQSSQLLARPQVARSGPYQYIQGQRGHSPPGRIIEGSTRSCICDRSFRVIGQTRTCDGRVFQQNNSICRDLKNTYRAWTA